MRRLISVVLVALVPGTVAAQSALDLMFYTPHFENTAPAAVMSYHHVRQSGLQNRLGPDLDTRIDVTRGGEGESGETVVTLDADSAPRQLDNFRGVPGNPILMVFMETVVSSLSKATGGSPFYIRNRLKDSFAAGRVGVSEGDTEIVFEPFVNDRNRERMGPFADLEVVMTLSESRPGMFGTLLARTGTAEPALYLEEMRYVESN